VYNFVLKFMEELYEEGPLKTFISFSHFTEIVGWLLNLLFSGGGGVVGSGDKLFEIY
jgi:hypothetical protein